MKQRLLFIFILLLLITGCDKAQENMNGNKSIVPIKKDRVSGDNYTAHGITVKVPTEYANRYVISDLKISFLNGEYKVNYCIEDIYSSKKCDIEKISAKGSYTIEDDILRLNISESTMYNVVYDKTENNTPNTNRTCKIIENDQIIIDCESSGGWIYFSKYKDEKYLTSSDCEIFNNKTYTGEKYISGFYLRNGTWVSSPDTITKSITFKDGKLADTYGGIFASESCEKESDTKYKIGERSATYNPGTDTLTINIGTRNGISYGTMEFIEKSSKKASVEYPEITSGWECDNNDNCKYKSSTTISELKKFASDNGLTMKIIYQWTNPEIPNGTVLHYCDVKMSSDDGCVIISNEGRKAQEGDTFIIEVEKHS